MNSHDIKSAIEVLNKKIESAPDDSSLYYERGKLYWKAGNKPMAMTDWNTALSIDPQSPAKAYIDMAGDIMDFYNTDLYNP